MIRQPTSSRAAGRSTAPKTLNDRLGDAVQAILVSTQASATISTSYFFSAAPAIFANNLATVSVGASLSAVQALQQGMPSGCRLLTFSGSTVERQATWGSSPNAIGFAALNTPYFDSTLSQQLFAEGLSATGWSSRTSAGV
jgi:hypothetical protein